MSKEDNKDFIEQQNKGFQRSIYWNENKTKGQDEVAYANAFKYISLDPSFQGINRLFVMAYDNVNASRSTRDGRTRYYLPTTDIINIMLLLMEEIFMIIQSKMILKNIEN